MAESNIVIYAALAANVAIAVTKGIAAAMTGASSMFSEAIHSLVDCTNQVLLLFGQKRAKRPPDDMHPLGYGQELYFWSFVVAILVFSLGAGISFYEGYLGIADPERVSRPMINYIVLGIAFLFEGTSWTLALREFSHSVGEGGWWQAFKDSKDPAVFIPLFEDTAALTGILIAATALFLAHWLDMPAIDGVGSILIGLVLAIVAFLLARESKHLLIGEQAHPELNRKMRAWLERQEGVSKVVEVISLQLAPHEIAAILTVDIDDGMSGGDAEQLAMRLERKATEEFDDLSRVFVRPRDAPDHAG